MIDDAKEKAGLPKNQALDALVKYILFHNHLTIFTSAKP